VSSRTVRPVYLAGGRLMAPIALCGLFWFSLAGDRQEAPHQLATITQEAYRADYDSALARIRTEAKQSEYPRPQPGPDHAA